MDFIVKKQFKGSPNGRTVIDFEIGDSFDPVKMGQSLTSAAIKDGSIAKAAEKKPVEKKAKAKK